MRRNLDLRFAVFRAGVFVRSIGDLGRLYHSQSPGDDLLRFLTLECPWQTSGPVWRLSFLQEIGVFDETLLSLQDLEMHVRAISAPGRYICFPDVDHDIRWNEDGSKTSVRHFRDPVYIEAAERVPVKLLCTLRKGGQLTWSRLRALTGLCFGAAKSWVHLRRLGRALLGWHRGCQELQAPFFLEITGHLMLCAGRLGRAAQEGILWRLVSKWKGWTRLRQEPSLLKGTGEVCP